MFDTAEGSRGTATVGSDDPVLRSCAFLSLLWRGGWNPLSAHCPLRPHPPPPPRISPKAEHREARWEVLQAPRGSSCRCHSNSQQAPQTRLGAGAPSCGLPRQLSWGCEGQRGERVPPRDLGLPVTVLPGKGAPCGRGTPLPGAASLLRVPVVHFLNSKLGVRLCGRS